MIAVARPMAMVISYETRPMIDIGTATTNVTKSDELIEFLSLPVDIYKITNNVISIRGPRRF